MALTQHSELSTQNSILTLSQLTAGITKVFEESFPGQFWIKAEVAKLNHYPASGHCYPSLVEKDKGVVKAEMRSTIWANDFMRINQRFLQVTKEPLKEGIQILFRAWVKFHPVYGLSLQISDIDPSYTLGEMAREKMETIMRLKNEGVFERNREITLPLLPKRIAIISVRTSKGFSDFINILENNPWGYAFSCTLFPALLQGDKAVDSITNQLKTISRFAEHFDIVAIIRGGGGDVGLNCYDNYKLAKEVTECPLPIVTGIGHSTNETVIEMIAAFNKITPTDVAYFIIQQFHNFAARVEESINKIKSLSIDLLEEEKKRWEDRSQQLIKQAENLLKVEETGLGRLSSALISVTRSVVGENKHLLELASSRIRYKPGLLIKEQRLSIKNKTAWLDMLTRQMAAKNNALVGNLEQKIRLLDPLNVLRRGYSITYFKGKPLTSGSGLKPGDAITTRLYEGNIFSEIKSSKE